MAVPRNKSTSMFAVGGSAILNAKGTVTLRKQVNPSIPSAIEASRTDFGTEETADRKTTDWYAAKWSVNMTSAEVHASNRMPHIGRPKNTKNRCNSKGVALIAST